MKQVEWPGIATAVAIIFIVSIQAWLGVWGPIWNSVWLATPDQWLGFAGNLIGATATLIAALFAWLVVQNQVRLQERTLFFTLALREEERLAKELPILQAASDIVRDVSFRIQASDSLNAVAILAGFRFHGTPTETDEELRRRLPEADVSTRAKLTNLFNHISFSAHQLLSADLFAKGDPNVVQRPDANGNIPIIDPHEFLRFSRESFKTAVEDMIRIHQTYMKEINSLSKRLVLLRAQINDGLKLEDPAR